MEALLRKEITNIINETDDVSPESTRLLCPSSNFAQMTGFGSSQTIQKSSQNIEGIGEYLLSDRIQFSVHSLPRFLDDTRQTKYNFMEKYFNRIKQLSDDVEAKDQKYLRQILFAQMLNNIILDYQPLISSITQDLRNNKAAFSIEALFSNSLQKSKRLNFEEENNNTILFT